MTAEETTITILGSIAFAGAVPLTLVVVAYLLRIIVIAGAILDLAHRTLPAAGGIAANTAAIANLEATRGVAGKILATAQAIDGVAATIAGKLRAVASAVERRSS